ncbi:PDZ domain-containing protein [Hydrogenimonas sp.]
MARRLAFGLASLFLALLPAFAAGGESCFRFFPGSVLSFDGHTAYAVAKGRFVFLHPPKNHPIVTHDPLTGLYLFKADVKRPLYLSSKTHPLYFCPAKGKVRVRARRLPLALRPGLIAPVPKREGALFTECCKLVGVVRSDGSWYGKAAIEKLLKGDTYHGDAGVRFASTKEGVRIAAVDPFADTGMRRGDRVRRVDGKRATLAGLLERMDTCRPNRRLKLLISRDGREYERSLTCFRRMGGGVVPDTFLERFGLRFDEELRISWLDERGDAYRRGLRVGDRLVWIDGRPVANPDALRQRLTDYAEAKKLPSRMLWEREGFQFFLLPYTL